MSAARFTAALSDVAITYSDLSAITIVQASSMVLASDALTVQPAPRRGAPRREFVWLYGLDGEQVGVVT